MNCKNTKHLTTKIVNKLKKEDITFDDFLEELSKNTQKFFNDPQLEFELLISNGFPMDIKDDKVFLKTLKTPINEQNFCIVDIETNGVDLDKGHQIIELGAVKYKNKKIIDKFESLVYAKDIPQYIQEVTNITPNMLENAPTIQNVLKKFKLFLKDDVFVAHNIKFDYNFISNSLEKYDLGRLENRKLCTIDLAKRTINARRYGLKYLKEYLNINIDNHHRAYSDALSTTYILRKSLKLLGKKVKTAEDLIYFSKTARLIIPEIKPNLSQEEVKKE